MHLRIELPTSASSDFKKPDDIKLMNVHPITLQGSYVRLEPLSYSHHADLCEVGLDEELWKVSMTLIWTPEEMKKYIDAALREHVEGKSSPFAIVDTSSGKAIRSTLYGNIDTAHHRVEIGWTWIGRKWHRTGVNTEAKLLLLTHAFETLKCIRVEFKTDSINNQSGKALLRIGAKEERVFRNHMIAPGGRIRHSVYYSIIDVEWKDVKTRLEKKLLK